MIDWDDDEEEEDEVPALDPPPKVKKKPKTVCVDFDGVISDYKSWTGFDEFDPIKAGAYRGSCAIEESRIRHNHSYL